jgi:thiamine biosynthesis lipoprotein
MKREAWLMGTRLSVTASAPSRQAAVQAIESVFHEVERVEAALSSWREGSEISRLNSAAVGEEVQLSAEVAGLLDEIGDWVRRTERAFDPAVGPLIDAWDLRGQGRVPPAAELDRAVAASAFTAFELDPVSRRGTRTDAGAWLTAGGFGKGAALRAARNVLTRTDVESALLDFGGQLVAVGTASGGRSWPVAVAHPARRDSQLVVLHLRDRSVATTAASERYVEASGVRYGHVLDPRTGWPAEPWGSATVVCEDPLVADVLSTALFVLGPERGGTWAEGLEGVGVLFLQEMAGAVEARWNQAMEPWLVGLSPSARALDPQTGEAAWRTVVIGLRGEG